MSIRFTRIAALALSLAVIGAAGQPAAAADGDTQQAQQSDQKNGQQNDGQNAAAPDFADKKLDAFANAAVKVSQVRRTWAPKIRKAQQGGNKQKAQQLAQQATGEMRTTIEQADDISLKEYQQIAQAAQQDQELAKQLSGMVKQKMQGQNQGQGQSQGQSGSQQ